MPSNVSEPNLGTGLSETLTGTAQDDYTVGLAGNDTIRGLGGNDIAHGDYAQDNLLTGIGDNQSMSGYGASDAWDVEALDNRHQQMTQQVATEIGGIYDLQLSLAANFAAGRTGAAVEIVVDGVVIATVTTQSGAFSDHAVSFSAKTTLTEITFRSVDGADATGPSIDTSGPAFHFEAEMQIGGQTVTLARFADGQSNLYQVLNGTLHVFDVETQSYQIAGVSGTVNVNSLGYNSQDDLLYAIAVGSGTDTLGNAVSASDLVMIDAEGRSYRIGETPYRSWTGDFDDAGNLWSFQSSMNHIAVIDVDSFDAAGNPLVTVHKFPKSLVDVSVYDVAFDAGTQSFYGVARPAGAGQETVLLIVDISDGTPQFRSMPVVATVVGDQVLGGVPAMTFGAAIVDADGTLYVGGNAGDHDMSNATASSGAIYRVEFDAVAGTASLHLIEEAPKSYSNDGAADATAESPFAAVDLQASVLIRDLSLVATAEGELTFDDDLSGNAGHDSLFGGLGEDSLTGGSQGDILSGGAGGDLLHGGAGTLIAASAIISIYDENGVRFDQFGNLLNEDDDVLNGGDGEDTLFGAAGHDTLHGGDGDDSLEGGSGSDELAGGAGDDDLGGGSQSDRLSGDAGADSMRGGSGDDTLIGGSGNDSLNGQSGDDHGMGGDGHDNIRGSAGNDTLEGGAGSDELRGGSGDDSLMGGDDADWLTGGSGNDTLSGDEGADSLNGARGQDVLTGGGGNDRLNGGSGADHLSGADGQDRLNGGSGDDTLDGGGGRDRIYLGAGADVALGGDGADRFIFRSQDLDGSTDRILDFSISAGDRLDLRALDLSVSDAQSWFEANSEIVGGADLRIALNADTTLVLTSMAPGTEEDPSEVWQAILF